MKKMMTILSALLLTAGLASAQTADTTQHHRGFDGRKMAMHRQGGREGHGFNGGPRINLSDDQKTQLKAINEDYRKQLNALQSNNSISLGDYKTKLAALHKSHREQITGIYTPEQKKMLADRRQNMQKRMHERGAKSLDKMKENLGLSDDQVAKIKAQRQELGGKMKAIRENTNLLPEQKREQTKQLFAQQKEQLKSVLTADQLSKFDSLRQHRPMMHRGGFRQQAK